MNFPAPGKSMPICPGPAIGLKKLGKFLRSCRAAVGEPEI
jgi:hypothetical protein